MKLFIAIFFALWIFGCSYSSHVFLGNESGTRVAVDPEAVQIYQDAPKKYVKIAIITASSKHAYAITEQGRTNAVISRAKQEAAKIGANGLLFPKLTDEYATTTRVYSGWAAAPVSSSSEQIKIIEATAIYVEEK
jgi:hypothetical protein